MLVQPMPVTAWCLGNHGMREHKSCQNYFLMWYHNHHTLSERTNWSELCQQSLSDMTLTLYVFLECSTQCQTDAWSKNLDRKQCIAVYMDFRQIIPLVAKHMSHEQDCIFMEGHISEMVCHISDLSCIGQCCHGHLLLPRSYCPLHVADEAANWVLENPVCHTMWYTSNMTIIIIHHHTVL